MVNKNKTNKIKIKHIEKYTLILLLAGYILGIWGIILAIPLGGIIIVIWKKIKTLEFFNN